LAINSPIPNVKRETVFSRNKTRRNWRKPMIRVHISRDDYEPGFYTPVRMTEIQNTGNTKCWWGWGGAGIPIHCWRESKCMATLEDNWQFLIKLDTFHRIQQSCLLVFTKICTQTFIAVLFITANTWKQPRCSSGGDE
jgi:hypothetical protein